MFGKGKSSNTKFYVVWLQNGQWNVSAPYSTFNYAKKLYESAIDDNCPAAIMSDIVDFGEEIL